MTESQPRICPLWQIPPPLPSETIDPHCKSTLKTPGKFLSSSLLAPHQLLQGLIQPLRFHLAAPAVISPPLSLHLPLLLQEPISGSSITSFHQKEQKFVAQQSRTWEEAQKFHLQSYTEQPRPLRSSLCTSSSTSSPSQNHPNNPFWLHPSAPSRPPPFTFIQLSSFSHSLPPFLHLLSLPVAPAFRLTEPHSKLGGYLPRCPSFFGMSASWLRLSPPVEGR